MFRATYSTGQIPLLDVRRKGRGVCLCLIVLLIGTACTSGPVKEASAPLAPSQVRLSFIAESDDFVPAAQEYERIWAEEGPRIIEAMESISGLRFDNPIYADTVITVLVLEQPSSSGYRERPMQMRASYPSSTKRATLIHELGHRLQSNLFRFGEDDHGPLFLWIYDVWAELYGRPFADSEVEVEKRRRGPYPAAWDSTVTLKAEQRARQWGMIRDERLAEWCGGNIAGIPDSALPWCGDGNRSRAH